MAVLNPAPMFIYWDQGADERDGSGNQEAIQMVLGEAGQCLLKGIGLMIEYETSMTSMNYQESERI